MVPRPGVTLLTMRTGVSTCGKGATCSIGVSLLNKSMSPCQAPHRPAKTKTQVGKMSISVVQQCGLCCNRVTILYNIVMRYLQDGSGVPMHLNRLWRTAVQDGGRPLMLPRAGGIQRNLGKGQDGAGPAPIHLTLVRGFLHFLASCSNQYFMGSTHFNH